MDKATERTAVYANPWRLGQMQYRFEYLDWSQTQMFRGQLGEFMKTIHADWQIPSSLSSIVSADLRHIVQLIFVLWHYRCKARRGNLCCHSKL